MEKPPFKVDGIYVSLMDREKDLNDKPTKLGKMWGAALGERDEHTYEILIFRQDDKITGKFNANMILMTGELLSLADNNKHCYKFAYQDINFSGNVFQFEKEAVRFIGFVEGDFIKFSITNKARGISYRRIYRYIPHDPYYFR